MATTPGGSTFGGAAHVSGEVVTLLRGDQRDFWRELARELRFAAEWMDRLGARRLASRYRREAARLE